MSLNKYRRRTALRKWEDVDEDNEGEDEESKAAVDRVKKYKKAQVVYDDEGGFDARYDRSMEEWNRGYHKVRLPCFFLPWTMCTDRC
jgi:hypothetical protein